MVDFAMDVHKSLYPDKEVPAALKEKRTQVVENFSPTQAWWISLWTSTSRCTP